MTGPPESHRVDRPEALRPEWRGDIAVAEAESQGDRLAARRFDLVEMPHGGAREAVLRRSRRVPAGAEPREDDRDAAADRPSRREGAVWAGEQHRPLVRRPPRRHLRSLQEEFPGRRAERDRGLDQPVFRLGEIEDAGNAEFGVEFRGADRSSFHRGASSPIGALWRHHEFRHASLGHCESPAGAAAISSLQVCSIEIALPCSQ